jgi:hypothetical protein
LKNSLLQTTVSGKVIKSALTCFNSWSWIQNADLQENENITQLASNIFQSLPVSARFASGDAVSTSRQLRLLKNKKHGQSVRPAVSVFLIINFDW